MKLTVRNIEWDVEYKELKGMISSGPAPDDPTEYELESVYLNGEDFSHLLNRDTLIEIEQELNAQL